MATDRVSLFITRMNAYEDGVGGKKGSMELSVLSVHARRDGKRLTLGQLQKVFATHAGQWESDGAKRIQRDLTYRQSAVLFSRPSKFSYHLNEYLCMRPSNAHLFIGSGVATFAFGFFKSHLVKMWSIGSYQLNPFIALGIGEVVFPFAAAAIQALRVRDPP